MMRKFLFFAVLVLGIGAAVLAVLAMLQRLSWTYALLALGATAVAATISLLWQISQFRRKNDKTVRSKHGL